jgi:hypothetical protein
MRRQRSGEAPRGGSPKQRELPHSAASRLVSPAVLLEAVLAQDYRSAVGYARPPRLRTRVGSFVLRRAQLTTLLTRESFFIRLAYAPFCRRIDDRDALQLADLQLYPELYPGGFSTILRSW